MVDSLNAIPNNHTKNNNNSIIYFNKRMAPSDQIAVHAVNYKLNMVFSPKAFGKELIKSVEERSDKLEYYFRLIVKRSSHFYLFIPKRQDKQINLHKIRSLPLIMGSEPFVVDLAQIVLSLSQKNHISRYFIDSVVLLISFTVNGPNRRSNIRKETITKNEKTDSTSNSKSS